MTKILKTPKIVYKNLKTVKDIFFVTKITNTLDFFSIKSHKKSVRFFFSDFSHGITHWL